jgi:Calpain family cysteine protease
MALDGEVSIIVIDSDDETSLSASQQAALAVFRSIVPQQSSEDAVSYLKAADWNVELALDQSFHRSPSCVSAPQVSKSNAPVKKRSRTETKESATLLSEQWHNCVISTMQATTEHFIDPDFPPASSSLDGRARSSSSDPLPMTLCLCGLPATPKQVQSEGPNYGRFYLICGRSTRSRPFPRANETTETYKTTKPALDPIPKVKASETAPNDGMTAVFSLIRNPYKKSNQEASSPSKNEANSATESVNADGEMKGREQPCSFFQWDSSGILGTINSTSNGSGYGGTIRNLSWCHFGIERGCVLYRKCIHVSQIRQGTVGNCWFLSALAVVAEKPYLIERILPHAALNTTGCYQINLFLDGTWQPMLVDSYLPVVVKPRGDVKSHSMSSSRFRAQDGIPLHPSRKMSKDGTDLGASISIGSVFSVGSQEYLAVPAFCATPDRQLWPALIEKAYAKAHGSYQQLSGGYIAEGLQDLTGAPTETYVFQVASVDLDAFWMKLLSFHSAGFLMGVATYSGGDGLVGGHAYSVLDVLDIPNTIVGEQSKLTDYFSSNPHESGNICNESSCSSDFKLHDERKALRLVRIRNPWGRREWKGDWSTESERWTRALRKRLGHDTTYAKGDGTFYMSFDDMMQRFHHMDVAKTQQVQE